MSPQKLILISNLFVVTTYIFLWGGARVRGCVRRWQQPVLRGRDWFFNVRVQPCFYSGPGAKLLRAYRKRIFVSALIEVPVATAILISGRWGYLSLLVFAMAAFIHIFHVFSVDLAERQARKYAVAEEEQPVAALAVSLTARRLRDYSDRNLEIAMALTSIVAIVWLVGYYLASPDHHDLRLVFWGPLFLLYMQAGFLFAKLVVVKWRTPVPEIHAEEHLEAREATRKLYLRICDINRALLSVALLVWPAMLSAPPARRAGIAILWLAGWLVLGIVLTVWQEIKRKRLLAVTLRARPVRLPDFLGQSNAVGWPLCYQPSAPMLVLKGARGYSLNLANTLAHVGAAYLAGLAVLLLVLYLGH